LTIGGSGAYYGVTVNGAADVTIKNCDIVNFGTGIKILPSSARTIIENNNLQENTAEGIGLYSQATIKNNFFSGNEMRAIRYDAHSPNSIIISNDFFSSGISVFPTPLPAANKPTLCQDGKGNFFQSVPEDQLLLGDCGKAIKPFTAEGNKQPLYIDGDIPPLELGDTDNDGVVDYKDNCPSIPNPGQENSDLCVALGEDLLCNLPSYKKVFDESVLVKYEVEEYYDRKKICYTEYGVPGPNTIYTCYQFDASVVGGHSGLTTYDRYGDACDWNDFLQGPNEAGVDCGGLSGMPCITCSWCAENHLVPLRLSGLRNTIDVVIRFGDDVSGTPAELEKMAKFIIQEDYDKQLRAAVGFAEFSNTLEPAGVALPSDIMDRFNFYLWHEDYYDDEDRDDFESWADVVQELYNDEIPQIFGFGSKTGRASMGPPGRMLTLKPNIEVDHPTWYNANTDEVVDDATLHELGHALFGFWETYDISQHPFYEEVAALYDLGGRNTFDDLEECQEYISGLTGTPWDGKEELCNEYFNEAKLDCYVQDVRFSSVYERCVMGDYADSPFIPPTWSILLEIYDPFSAMKVKEIFDNWDEYNSFDPGSETSAVVSSGVGTISTAAVVDTKAFQSKKRGLMVVYQAKGNIFTETTKLSLLRSKPASGYHNYKPCTENDKKGFEFQVLSASGSVLQKFCRSDPRMAMDGSPLAEAEESIAFPPDTNTPTAAIKIVERDPRKSAGQLAQLTIDLTDAFAEFCKTNPTLLSCKSVLPKPIAKWSGEGNAQDSAGNTHGTVAKVLFPAGKKGKAFQFDGKNSISLGTAKALDIAAKDFSIHTYVKFTEKKGNARAILQMGGFDTKWALTTGFGDTGQDKLGFALGKADKNGGVLWYYDAGKGINDGKWHSVIVVKKGSDISITIDGTKQAHKIGRMKMTTSNVFGLGYHGNYNGALDEVSIYGQALSPEQLQSIT
ncbi:MAG TPA: LamG-like jellyroll fold domain-containing protein, partial [Candidatus Nanoarchaeia archaeon]|nr:LamG-like jellyroll fold domain-containing protein [Candidatus Nanoarchaeia archaeon]